MAVLIAQNPLQLSLTIEDIGTSAPLDLTGATVSCKIVDPTSSHITVSATVTNAAAGSVSVTLTASQLTPVGMYTVACRVTFPDTSTTETLPFTFVTQAPLF